MRPASSPQSPAPPVIERAGELLSRVEKLEIEGGAMLEGMQARVEDAMQRICAGVDGEFRTRPAAREPRALRAICGWS